MIKLIPKCQTASGFKNMGEQVRKQISLGTSSYKFKDENGQEREGYWFTDDADGKQTLTVQDKGGQWRLVSPQSDGTYKTVGDINFMGNQNLTGENGEELTVTPQGASWQNNNYRSAHDGSLSNFIETTNALTGGIINRLSPTQNARLAYDTYQWARGNKSWGDVANSMVFGNNGIVSNQFAEEHPYWSMAINGIGDAVAGGALAYRMGKSARDYNKFANQVIKESAANESLNLKINPEELKGITSNIETQANVNIGQKPIQSQLFSEEQVQKIYDQAKQWHLNRIKGNNFKQRALNAGFSEEEIPKLQAELERNLNTTAFAGVNPNMSAHAQHSSFAVKLPNGTMGLRHNITYNPNKIRSLNELMREFVHEQYHGMTLGLGSQEENAATNLGKYWEQVSPYTARAARYNSKIKPNIATKEEITEFLKPSLRDSQGNMVSDAQATAYVDHLYDSSQFGLKNYVDKTTEMGARAATSEYDFRTGLGNKWDDFRGYLNSPFKHFNMRQLLQHQAGNGKNVGQFMSKYLAIPALGMISYKNLDNKNNDI